VTFTDAVKKVFFNIDIFQKIEIMFGKNENESVPWTRETAMETILEIDTGITREIDRKIDTEAIQETGGTRKKFENAKVLVIDRLTDTKIERRRRKVVTPTPNLMHRPHQGPML